MIHKQFAVVAMVLALTCGKHVCAQALGEMSADGRGVLEADYVVVGGGTAGCALAARLCEGLPDAHVVVLERGTPRDEDQELSVRAIRLMFSNLDDPDITETIISEPNEFTLDRQFTIRTGKTLGGTSAIAGMQFARPPVEVVTDWGLTGLDAETANRLYAQAMAQTQASPQPEELEMTYLDEWLQANVLAGVPLLNNRTLPDGDYEDGVWESFSMVDDQGQRMDSAFAYLEPVLEAGGACLQNLEVIEDATVGKILLEDSMAVGVEYFVGNDSSAQPEVVLAAKEVIVSAGPYGSPKLLMMSGIGPAEDLEELGINVYADLPVGQNAQERPFAPNVFLYTDMPIPPEAMTDVVLSAEAEALFLAAMGGVLATTPAMGNGIWAPPIGAWRGGAMMPFDVTIGTPENLGVVSCDLNPSNTSRSTVTLNSTDVFSSPTVELNLLMDPDEVVRMALCYEAEREVQVGLEDLGFNITELLPGDVASLEDAVVEQSENANNFVGGCGIGRVLDQDLKVIGFSNLRVVDASAIPDMTPNSSPMATVYMLAEFAAEVLVAEGGPGGLEYSGNGRRGRSGERRERSD